MGPPAPAERPPRAAHGPPDRGRDLRRRVLIPSWYEAKKALLAPQIAHRRRKHAPDLDPYGLALCELHYYRAAMFDFAAATGANPDILTDADIDAGALVIDAGAYVGEWSEKVAERYDPTIHAFEPSARAFTTLEAALGGRPKVHLHQAALGRRDHRAQLLDAGPGTAVIDDPGGASDDETIEVRDIAAVLDEIGAEHVDLLKLNIEGGEYDVIDRLAETGWLARTDIVSVQFHEWHPHAHRRRLRNRRALRRTHDEAWCYPWVWELWRRRAPTS